jgi:hypothetical protein
MKARPKGLRRAGLASGAPSCNVLAKGDKRRLSDGRNAWRKMDSDQREEFVGFLMENGIRDVVHFQASIIAAFVEVAK